MRTALRDEELAALQHPSQQEAPAPAMSAPPVRTKEQWIVEASNLYNAGQYQQALEALQQVLALDLTYAPAHFYMGHAHYALQVLEEALHAYDLAIQSHPDQETLLKARFYKAETLRALAVQHNSLDRAREALVAYDSFLQVKPNDAPGHFGRGETLRFLRSYEDALAAYRRSVQLQPSNADAYFYQAYMLRKLERFAEAIQAYRALLLVQPTHQVAQQQIAHLERLEPLTTRIEALHQELLAQPKNGELWHQKAQLLAQMGIPADAEQAARRARELGYAG
jgi:tetratricopeptide (TPR) repeat protein